MEELIVLKNSKSPIAEAYRSIRTSIQFANIDGKLKTVMFTSASAGEGKTTTLANVALTLADAGHRVILVDGDLRKPRIHKIFELSNQMGLTDMLLEGKSYGNYIYKAVYPGLDILTAGKIPKNPSEILLSQSMQQFLQRLREDYDYILVDAPPVLPVTDAVLMSAYIDGLVLVCASGQIQIEGAQRAKAELEKAKANILGVVLNKLPMKEQKYSHYYYYYANEKGEA